jgi:mono/diheme cytochrome c family protein
VTLWPRLALVCILTLLGRETAAQTAKPKTTRSGVYSSQQAKRGQDVYVGLCKSCHTAESHTGAVFAKWNGKPLSDLYGYISELMPKNEPASLSPEEYTDVVAYVLKLNGMPAGAKDLPADVAVMKTIRIETRTRSPHPAPRSTTRPVRKDP